MVGFNTPGAHGISILVILVLPAGTMAHFVPLRNYTHRGKFPWMGFLQMKSQCVIHLVAPPGKL